MTEPAQEELKNGIAFASLYLKMAREAANNGDFVAAAYRLRRVVEATHDAYQRARILITGVALTPQPEPSRWARFKAFFGGKSG